MRYFIICSIFIICFASFSYAASNSYLGTYSEAVSACGNPASCHGYTGETNLCWDAIRNFATGDNYWYPTSLFCNSSYCQDEGQAYLGRDVCSPVEEYATVNVNASGPGYVGGSACSEAIECPGANCSATSTVQCEVSLTAYPNMPNLTVDWDFSGNCVADGNHIDCLVNVGNTASITAVFADICVNDSDGDGIADYADVQDDTDDDSLAPVLVVVKAVLSYAGHDEYYGSFEELYNNLSNFQDANSDDVNESLSDPGLMGNTYFVIRNMSTGEEFGVGNSSVQEDAQRTELTCDPRYQYCGHLTNEQLASFYPCDPDNPLQDLQFADIIEPSDISLPDASDIPDGVYDSSISDCDCFDIVNKNTAATVDLLKQVVQVNSAIVENTGKTVTQLNTANALLEKISKKNFSSNFEDEDDFDQDDVENIIDALNDDSADADDIEALENNDENKAAVSYDDTSNDQLETLIDTEGQGLKEDIDQYNEDLNSFISGKFQVSVSSPSCSFRAPVFGGRYIEFNGCNYAGPLNTMGTFIKFISYLTGIIIILRA